MNQRQEIQKSYLNYPKISTSGNSEQKVKIRVSLKNNQILLLILKNVNCSPNEIELAPRIPKTAILRTMSVIVR
jgi:hypothetical protein